MRFPFNGIPPHPNVLKIILADLNPFTEFVAS